MNELENLLTCYTSGQMTEQQWEAHCRERPELRDMLAARRQGAGPAHPGWKLVPVEPTPDWIANLSGKGLRIGKLESAIEDMLAAAPTPPAAVQEQAAPSDEEIEALALKHVARHYGAGFMIKTPYRNTLQFDRIKAFARALLARYGAQPAAGEEIMVNAPGDVYTLPMQPSGLTSGPRFVVHVPAQPAASAEPITMPVLTDRMRAVLRNDGDVYGSEDELYAALVDAAQAQGKAAPVAAQASGQALTFEQWWASGGHRIVNEKADTRGWQGAAEAGYIGGLLASGQAQDAVAELVHAMFRSGNEIPVERITITRQQYDAARAAGGEHGN